MTIARKVESALLRDIDVDEGKVVVNVDDGVARLRGEVRTPELIEELGARANRVAEVRRVENLLHLPRTQPERAREESATVRVSGFPEEQSRHQHGDRSKDPSPHHALSNPVGEPDPTEWPDPYERREDPLDASDPDGRSPRDAPHVPTGATSTSRPHPSQDVEAEPTDAPARDS